MPGLGGGFEEQGEGASSLASIERDTGTVVHLGEPDDAQLSTALASKPDAVAILVKQDERALRYALAVAHLDPATRIVVTIFDRTVGEQVRKLLPQATVTSPADLAAPNLAGPCVGPDVVAVWHSGENEIRVLRTEAGPRLSATRLRAGPRPAGVLGQLFIRLRSHDPGTQLLLIGFAGLLGVLVADWSWLVIASHRDPIDAFVEAARVVATVGPGHEHGDAAYSVFAGTAMLFTLGLTAMFPAGLIDRLLQPRLLGLFGSRRPPRSEHVVVVGMGQVGIRLCVELRRLGVAAVGVERDPVAPQMHVARALKIPIVVGHGWGPRCLGKPRHSARTSACRGRLGRA